MENSGVRVLALSGLLLALMALSAQLSLPTPWGVPFTFQTLILMLVALTLPLREATLTCGSYLLLGGLGLPVFSRGQGGLAVLAGPTGGFLIGFLAAPALARAVWKLGGAKFQNKTHALISACAAAVVPVFAGGVAWLIATGVSWYGALVTCGLLFLPGEAIKVLCAVSLYRALDDRGLVGSLPYLEGTLS